MSNLKYYETPFHVTHEKSKADILSAQVDKETDKAKRKRIAELQKQYDEMGDELEAAKKEWLVYKGWTNHKNRLYSHPKWFDGIPEGLTSALSIQEINNL